MYLVVCVDVPARMEIVVNRPNNSGSGVIEYREVLRPDARTIFRNGLKVANGDQGFSMVMKWWYAVFRALWADRGQTCRWSEVFGAD